MKEPASINHEFIIYTNFTNGYFQTSQKDEGENALDVSNVGGVFVVLIVGMGIAFTISILEFLLNIRKVAVVEKVSLK